MSEKKWNSKHCELAMKNLQNSVADEYPNLNLNYPYLDNLCKQTNSKKTLDLIKQAYYLGMARGITRVDQGMTPVTIDPFEMGFCIPNNADE